VTFDFAEFGALGQDVGFGYLDKTVLSPRQLHPQLVLNTETSSMLRALRDELKRSHSFAFSVAFVSPRAIALLKQELIDFIGSGRIVTSDYLGFNSPAAFRELLGLRKFGIDVRLHTETAFHPKGYVFRNDDGVTAILGSSNLTENALARNHEWNLRVSAATTSDLADQFTNLVDQQVEDSIPLAEEWIAAYELDYRPPAVREATGIAPIESPPSLKQITPNTMQVEALSAIESVRAAGHARALVISATGTGKTILSALDVRAVAPKRLLFVAHREQILDRAIQEFGRVLGAPPSDFGKLSGSSRQQDRRFVFATVQSLSQPDVLASLPPDTFDYILIDEVHRAGAATYGRVIDHFTPQFLLGMTATPERSDGLNVFEIFDYNVPYEIRLNAALDLEMLSPFHYYGVADFTFEDGHVTSEATPMSRLVAEERVAHVLDALETYGQAGVPARGLIFCSRNDEAAGLSAELNRHTLRGAKLRTVALSGSDSIAHREHTVERLEAGEIDYILTVDIFNEGVDIPSVNQVVMLRQTQSSIVFVQQLGRGLRKTEAKEYLVVIDFIGNYANNYMIPIALFGDNSLNKESLRKNLIAAEERGVISGLSSVRFDRISQDRVLSALTSAKLDSLHNLKAAIDLLRNRLGRVPDLYDFLQFESADPVLLATKEAHYPALLEKLLKIDPELSAEESRILAVLSREVLNAKRLHEVTMLGLLLHGESRSAEQISEAFATAGVPASDVSVQSAARTLSLDFNTSAERQKYATGSLIELDAEGSYRLAPTLRDSYSANDEFRRNVDGLVKTSRALIAARYELAEPFTHSRQYSRKDASRLLNWATNGSGTIFGYRVDPTTRSCPIFVTHNKSEEVSASTAYEDKLIDPSTMLWFTKSNRRLSSADVRAIVSGEIDLHVFAKKDDAEGTDFYYLGKAHAEHAMETTMRGDNGEPVVRMNLKFERPMDSALFDYFHPIITA
jgi:superfamily II DNA or RNA helicase/HKD family nuclease